MSAALTATGMGSIKNKIVVFALLATLIPALSTAVVSYVQNKQALTEKLDEELRNVTAQTARELTLWIRERRYEVRVSASSYEVSENLERIPQGGARSIDARSRIKDFLEAVRPRFTDYTELFVTDVQRVRAASSADSVSDAEIPEAWIEPLRLGNEQLSAPFWDEQRAAPAAMVAVPIRGGSGRFVGIMAGILNFEQVAAMLEQFALGDQRHVYLVTDDGTVVVGSSATRANGFEAKVEPRTLTSLREANGLPIQYASLSRVPVVGAYATIAQTPWSVIVEVPRNQAFSQITRLRNVTFFLVSGLLIVVGGIAYVLGVFIVRPLGRLTDGAREVAAGNLMVDLPVLGGGEVGYLTEVFNDMVSRLRSGREELDAINAKLREQNVELEQLSITDALTGLSNRRHLMRKFVEEIERADRVEKQLCLLMMDVDHFKKYNDTHGHQAGDDVLVQVGKAIMQATRGLDTPARYGGEEFSVLLPECTLEGALEAAERIRKRLAAAEVTGGPVTLSIGVAVYPTEGETPETLIASADAALYEAKRLGRDRVYAPQRDGIVGTIPDTKPKKPKGRARRRAKTATD